MKEFLVILLFISFGFLSAQKNVNIVNVPNGSALLTNGIINENVWNSANKLSTNCGDEVYLIHDEEYLYIGFRGAYEPWSHLYINTRSKVYVMHISPAMGRVVYNMNYYGVWNPDRRFNWKMRHPEYDPNKKVDTKKFLNDEGWITGINSSGIKKEVVFKIALKTLDRKNIYAAFVYGLKEDSYLYWPRTLNDDTLKPEMFTGYNPSDLKFDFKKWANLKLSE